MDRRILPPRGPARSVADGRERRNRRGGPDYADAKRDAARFAFGKCRTASPLWRGQVRVSLCCRRFRRGARRVAARADSTCGRCIAYVRHRCDRTARHGRDCILGRPAPRRSIRDFGRRPSRKLRFATDQEPLTAERGHFHAGVRNGSIVNATTTRSVFAHDLT